MQFVSKTSVEIERNSVLLLSTVSVGNVGQLCCEVLLSTFPHTLLGYFIDPNLLPCFGMEPFHKDSPSALSLELYELKDTSKRIYILQQRAPAQIGRQKAFARNLASWIVNMQFNEVLVLTSVDASVRGEDQLKSKGSWMVQHKTDSISARFQSLSESILTSLRNGVLPPWPLWSEFENRGVNAKLIGCFTVEGDNLFDGIQQAKDVAEMLELLPNDQNFTPKLSPSVQWSYGLQR